MGFSTWNTFRGQIDQASIYGVADAITSSGLLAKGYNYINIDDEWAAYDRDARGRIVADKTKFPDGMAALAGRLHRGRLPVLRAAR